MQLVKWSPMRDFFGMNKHFNTLFDDFFYPSQSMADNEDRWKWNPAVDIYENEDSIVVQAELPGVERDQIAVDVDGRILTLKGERSTEQEAKEDNYYRRERVYGRFERAFTLPAEVDPDQIKADFKDGVLKIEVPKPETHKPKQITVH